MMGCFYAMNKLQQAVKGWGGSIRLNHKRRPQVKMDWLKGLSPPLGRNRSLKATRMLQNG
jgi:hypothetical protein